jgi:hypothetical protein
MGWHARCSVRPVGWHQWVGSVWPGAHHACVCVPCAAVAPMHAPHRGILHDGVAIRYVKPKQRDMLVCVCRRCPSATQSAHLIQTQQDPAAAAAAAVMAAPALAHPTLAEGPQWSLTHGSNACYIHMLQLLWTECGGVRWCFGLDGASDALQQLAAVLQIARNGTNHHA